MADAADDAAKAEKLAAAKKRFEQLKKQKSKKGGRVAAATSAPAEKPEEPTPEVAPADGEKSELDEGGETEAPKDTEPPKTASLSAEAPSAAAHSRSASIQARRTSTSHFRRPSVNATDILRSANKSPLSPTDVPDIYRRQAETISILTEGNERLAEDVEKLKAKEKRLGEVEAEKDKLQEQLAEVREELRGFKGRIDGAEEGNKKSGEEVEKMKSELEALHRQTSHLTSQVAAKDRTIAELRLASSGSSNSQDRESLTAKEDQIENMEIDLNKLRNELERTRKSLSSAEESLKARESAYDALQEELSTAQKELASAQVKISDNTAQYSSLKAQLLASKNELDAARAELKKKSAAIATLDKDHYTLKTMYRDAEAKSQESSRTAIAKSREAQDLADTLTEVKRKADADRDNYRIKLERALAENKKHPGSSSSSSSPPHTDDAEVDELEDAERNRLRERVRFLEEQLDAAERRNPPPPSSSSQSQPPLTRRARGMSMVSEGSFLSDDADFGEMMAAARQKEEAAAGERKRAEAERLERIREVKKGLETWKGWRMDLTLVGGSAHGLGEIFEV